MTAQINDMVFYRKINFVIAGISGTGLFEPQAHGIEPDVLSTACWRGYYVQYAIEDGLLLLTRVTLGLSTPDTRAADTGKGPVLFGACPRYDEQDYGWVYDGLRQPVEFSGGLLLGTRFVQELYIHMGFHPAWKYRDVREVLFEHGRLTSDFDRSADMEAARARLAEQPSRPDLTADNARIMEWIEQCFSRDYSL